MSCCIGKRHTVLDFGRFDCQNLLSQTSFRSDTVGNVSCIILWTSGKLSVTISTILEARGRFQFYRRAHSAALCMFFSSPIEMLSAVHLNLMPLSMTSVISTKMSVRISKLLDALQSICPDFSTIYFALVLKV